MCMLSRGKVSRGVVSILREGSVFAVEPNNNSSITIL